MYKSKLKELQTKIIQYCTDENHSCLNVNSIMCQNLRIKEITLEIKDFEFTIECNEEQTMYKVYMEEEIQFYINFIDIIKYYNNKSEELIFQLSTINEYCTDVMDIIITLYCTCLNLDLEYILTEPKSELSEFFFFEISSIVNKLKKAKLHNEF